MAKNKTNLKTLNAKAELYGNRVTPASVFRTMFAYEVIIIAYAALLFGPKNVIMIGIMALIGAIFVYRGIIPYKIDDVYRERSENERNQFMHLITQGMTAQDANMLNVLRNATDAASGEFYDDMIHLLVKLEQSRSPEICHPAFQKICDKYKEDIFFVMMMEQCETTFYEAQYHIETFRSFQESHDEMISQERYYEQKKQSWQTGLGIIVVLCFGAECVVMMFPGYKVYQKVWLNIIGFIISIIFFIALAAVVKKFYKDFYDNDVTHE